MVRFLEDIVIKFWSERRVNPLLQTILWYDQVVTKIILDNLSCYVGPYLQLLFKIVEISCSFVVWLIFWVCFAIFHQKYGLESLIKNLFMGIFLDLFVISCVKLITARKRPTHYGDNFLGAVGAEIFSFPSGHTSRAIYITYFFSVLYPVSKVYIFLLMIWSAAISISRILLERHFVLDIVGGVFFGITTSVIIGCIWLD